MPAFPCNPQPETPFVRLVSQKNQGSPYEIIRSRSECSARLEPYEPALCDELSWNVATVGM